MATQKTQAQQAYEMIRNKIISVELRPGEMLTEQSLIEMTGFGRSPVRDALQWLGQEDLVEISPRRGTFVSQLNFDDVQQIFDLRQALERVVADAVITRVTPAHVLVFDDLIQEVGRRDDPESDSSIDSRFHATLLEITGNRYLNTFYKHLHDASLRLFHLTRCEMETRADQRATLIAVRDALADKDRDALERILTEHVQDFRRRVGGAISR